MILNKFLLQIQLEQLLVLQLSDFCWIICDKKWHCFKVCLLHHLPSENNTGAESQIAYWLKYHKFKLQYSWGHCAGFRLSGGGKAHWFAGLKSHLNQRLPPTGGQDAGLDVSLLQPKPTGVGPGDVYYFRVCTKWQFHDTKLMEWVNHPGLPLIPIRQTSQVRKVTQLAS